MGAKVDVREGKVGKIYGAIAPVSITGRVIKEGQCLGSEQVNRVDLGTTGKAVPVRHRRLPSM